MKKYLISTSLLAVFTVLNISCKKEEEDPITKDPIVTNYLDGVYNPEKKISKIYQDEEGAKLLSESWTWVNNQVTKISYDEYDMSYELIEYKEKQITKIVSYQDGVKVGYTLFTYNNGLLKQIQLYSYDSLSQSIVVEHAGNKISKMISTDYEELEGVSVEKNIKNKTRLLHCLQFFIPKLVVDNLIKSLQKSNGIVTTMEFTYSGDNIISEEMTSEDLTMSATFTYDVNTNPFYNAFFTGNNGASVFSKNNPLTNNMTYDFSGNTVNLNTTYAYVYVDKYPSEITINTVYLSMNESYKVYYEYVE